MIPGLKIFHRGLILVGVPFLLELVLIVCLSILLYQSDQDQLKESTYRKIAAVNARLLLLTIETPYYLINSIRFSNEDLFHIYEKKHDSIRVNQQKLIALLKKAPDLSDGAREIQLDIDTVLKYTEDIAAARKGNLPELMTQMAKLMVEFDHQKNSAVEHLAQMMRSGEIRTKEMEDKQARIRRLQSMIITAGCIANLMAGILLAFFFRAGIVKRLGTIKQNTISLLANQALAKPLGGTDEITKLDEAFHAMDRDLKQAASREKELFDNASDVICVLDYNNQFVKVNNACLRIWGYEPQTLMSMTLPQILNANDLNALLDHIAMGKLTGEPFTFENHLITSGGQEIEVSWSAYWSQLDRQLYCVVHDISERKRTEKMKQKFLQMISSDLKKPLSEMSGAVAMLVGSLAEHLSTNAVAKLQVAGKNLQRLLGLVNDLLQVAEMESSTIDIKKEWCDTEEPLVRSVQEVEAVATKHNIKLEVNACQMQWLVDPNRIVQVLVNLLSNAIKFSPEGATVSLSAEQRGDLIEVRVRDRGRGVPESHRDAIFEKFKQVEAADGKRKSGTGLGLPICKQIVEDHGGSIGVESVDGEGSCFWFMIPRDESVSLKIKLQKKKQQEEIEKSQSEQLQSTHPSSAALNLPAGASTPSGAASLSGVALTSAGSSTLSNIEGKVAATQRFAGKIKLGYKGAILVGVPLAFEIILVGAISLLLLQVDHERKDELHYRNIAFHTSRLVNTYFMMAVGAISNDSPEKDFVIFRQGYESAKTTLKELEQTLANDKVGMSHLEQVKAQDKKIADEWVKPNLRKLELSSKRSIDYKSAMGGKERILPYIIKMARWAEKLCDDSEKKEFVSPERQRALRMRLAQILLAGLAANIAGSIVLALFFSADITSRLQILADNAMRLAGEKPLNAPLIGSDEIADLDRTFHETAAALEESRKKERAVFDNSQDVICALTTEGGFRSINPAVESMWGYSKAELIGKRLETIVSPDDVALIATILQAELNSHKEAELIVNKKNGEAMNAHWSYSRAAEGGDVLCVVHDITNLKELERIKQEFLGMVSHDLRTPLTSILGITKLILAGAFGEVEERPKRLLDRISNSGDKLLELINDLLDIEKLEAGKMQLVLEDMQVTELLKRAIEASRNQSRISLENDVDGSLTLEADHDRLVQALSNVLNYSLEQTPEDGNVYFSVHRQKDFLEFAVNLGSAPPLSDRAMMSLFNRFETSNDTGENSNDGSGAGLALPIAKKIVEGHGGSISATRTQDGDAIVIKLAMKETKPL